MFGSKKSDSNQRNVRRGNSMYAPGARASAPKSAGRSIKLPKLKSVALVIAVVAGVYLFYRGTTITRVTVQGNQAIPTATIQEAVEKRLQAAPWFNSYFLVGALRLGDTLTAANPRIKTVTLHRQFPHGLQVGISERQLGLVWQSAGQQWLIDNEGLVISPAQTKTELALVIDTANVPVKVGDRVAPARFIGFSQSIARDMQAQTGIGVSELDVPESTSELNVKTNKGYIVKFDTIRSPADELHDLKLVLKTMGDKKPTQYIDLRVPGKAYYL